eukprot:4830350-Prymnesium_polylepis.1
MDQLGRLALFQGYHRDAQQRNVHHASPRTRNGRRRQRECRAGLRLSSKTPPTITITPQFYIQAGQILDNRKSEQNFFCTFGGDRS